MSAECLEKRTRSPIGLFRFGGSVCRRHKRSVIFEKKERKRRKNCKRKHRVGRDCALSAPHNLEREIFLKNVEKLRVPSRENKNGKKERKHVVVTFSLRARVPFNRPPPTERSALKMV